ENPVAELFLFQADAGIRDGHVTGVQTCALPISDGGMLQIVKELDGEFLFGAIRQDDHPRDPDFNANRGPSPGGSHRPAHPDDGKIGRASGRERVYMLKSVVYVEKTNSPTLQIWT